MIREQSGFLSIGISAAAGSAEKTRRREAVVKRVKMRG
jgi:hypothetical protein